MGSDFLGHHQPLQAGMFHALRERICQHLVRAGPSELGAPIARQPIRRQRISHFFSWKAPQGLAQATKVDSQTLV